MVGKTSKKGWRNIKLTDTLETMASNEARKELDERVDTLFVEDSSGGSKGVSKRILQEIKLRGNSEKASVSASELHLLQKAISKTQNGVKKQQHVKKAALRDVWGDDLGDKRLKTLLPGTVLRRESLAPAVVPAPSTFSVNPSKDDFEAMLVAEAEKEELKKAPKKRTAAVTFVPPSAGTESSEVLPAENKVTERKTRAQKLKEKRHQQMLREHEIKRQEKQARKALQDKTTRKALEEEQARRREARLLTQARRVVAEASGKFTLARGAGGRLAETPESIPVEIAGSLRRIVPVGDPVSERRASLLKRRVIEQVPEMNAEYREKLRFARLDASKARKMIDKDASNRCVLLS
jgi:hypothetical protein